MERDDGERALRERCEREVKTHATEDAWQRARHIAEEHLHHWEASFGIPASDAFVAQEVCHELARELRRREPEPAAEARRVSEAVLRGLDPAARERLRDWLLELARREEHRAWLEVVEFTDHLARNLIRGGELTEELRWDFDHSYSRTAERITRMLIREYEAHAHGPAVVEEME
jgi:hypothetical protein